MPLHILVDGNDLRDGVDDVPADVHQRHATTAGATPAELADAYRRALAAERRRRRGGRPHFGGIVEHLQLCRGGRPRVRSRGAGRELQSAAMGVGFVALAAARAAAAGADLNAVEAAASSAVRAVMRSSSCTGWTICGAAGRIGGAASWLGTALSLKPLLRLDVDGRLVLGNGSAPSPRRTRR